MLNLFLGSRHLFLPYLYVSRLRRSIVLFSWALGDEIQGICTRIHIYQPPARQHRSSDSSSCCQTLWKQTATFLYLFPLLALWRVIKKETGYFVLFRVKSSAFARIAYLELVSRDNDANVDLAGFSFLVAIWEDVYKTWIRVHGPPYRSGPWTTPWNCPWTTPSLIWKFTGGQGMKNRLVFIAYVLESLYYNNGLLSDRINRIP